jgi:hypothetical protein
VEHEIPNSGDTIHYYGVRYRKCDADYIKEVVLVTADGGGIKYVCYQRIHDDGKRSGRVMIQYPDLLSEVIPRIIPRIGIAAGDPNLMVGARRRRTASTM